MISKEILDRCVGFSSVYEDSHNVDVITLKLNRKGFVLRLFLPYTHLTFKFSRRTEIRNSKYWQMESTECRGLIDQLTEHFSQIKKDPKE